MRSTSNELGPGYYDSQEDEGVQTYTISKSGVRHGYITSPTTKGMGPGHYQTSDSLTKQSVRAYKFREGSPDSETRQ
jgi:hypothetical protein